jgi:hypothetical protein
MNILRFEVNFAGAWQGRRDAVLLSRHGLRKNLRRTNGYAAQQSRHE